MGMISSVFNTALGNSVQGAQNMVAAKSAKDEIEKLMTDYETKKRSLQQDTTKNVMKVNEESARSISF